MPLTVVHARQDSLEDSLRINFPRQHTISARGKRKRTTGHRPRDMGSPVGSHNIVECSGVRRRLLHPVGTGHRPRGEVNHQMMVMELGEVTTNWAMTKEKRKNVTKTNGQHGIKNRRMNCGVVGVHHPLRRLPGAAIRGVGTTATGEDPGLIGEEIGIHGTDPLHAPGRILSETETGINTIARSLM